MRTIHEAEIPLPCLNIVIVRDLIALFHSQLEGSPILVLRCCDAFDMHIPRRKRWGLFDWFDPLQINQSKYKF